MKARLAPRPGLILDDGSRLDLVDQEPLPSTAVVLGGRVVKGGGKARRRKLAINRLRTRLRALAVEGLSTEGAIERFFARYDFPIVEGRPLHVRRPGQADVEASICVTGWSGCRSTCRCGGSTDTDLWYVVIEIPG